MADPSGCSYRAVQLVIPRTAGAVDFNTTTTPQGTFAQATTHGWMLPDGRVLSWNGIARLMPFAFSFRARLAADLELGIKHLAPFFGKPTYAPFQSFTEAQGMGFGDSGTEPAQRQRFIAPALLPTAWALLWRLGQSEILEEVFGTIQANDVSVGDPFLPMARSFLWARFVALLGRHRQAWQPDQLAQEARALTTDVRYFADEAKRRGIPGTPFAFVDEAREIARDAARRDVSPPRASFASARGATRTERIADLIARLDEIDSVPASMGVPVAADQHPIAERLLQEGDAAIPALRACAQTDRRLTRALRLDRNTDTGHQLVTVADVARACLERLSAAR